MQEIIINKNEAGQRVDKFLIKYLSNAEKNFIYKMIRKKNITLNGKKISGSEKLVCGDSVKLFFAPETLNKFTGGDRPVDLSVSTTEQIDFKSMIIYEDNNIILMNKPAGMLSQKAKSTDISINENMLRYLMDSGAISNTSRSTFTPSVCNRLDRNTSGLIIGGTSLQGLQDMSLALKERTLRKYYLCLVQGVMRSPSRIEGWLKKNEKTNKVSIYSKEEKDASYICTEYMPLGCNTYYSLLLVHLITGKTHQIRAHLSSIGHPIAGDTKYGDYRINKQMLQKYGLKHQLLHSYKLDFRDYVATYPELQYLEGKSFVAPPGDLFKKILQEEDLDGYLE